MNHPTIKQLTHLALAITLLATSAVYAQDKPKPFAQPQPQPQPLGDAAQFGANIQRTMTLLATSTPRKRNRVRILFYGQSVTRGAWWKSVAADLRERFPHADLEIKNRAVGGYGGPVLINTAEYDLYPFYPDLVIFHVWSGVESGHQEEIIRRIRQRTTAEVLLWTSNLRWPIWSVPPDGDPQHADVRYIEAQDQAISDLYFRLGKKFHCEVADVRSGMKTYLAKHKLLVKDTIADSVHPNKFGNFLISELVKPHLRYNAKFDDSKWKDLVTDIPLDDPRVRRAADGSLSLDFSGNRIDVIAAADAKDTTAAVLIDGKRPSQNPRLYYHARPTLAPGAGRPAINRIDHKTPLQVETWTARILECDLKNDVLRYEIIGSKTGPDGSGDHKKRFVSNSGRVIIEPGMWMLNWSLRYCKLKLPQDFKVTWQTLPLFLDTWKAPTDIDPTRESVATLAQGLKNSKHTLTLKPQGGNALGVKAFRVYQPPRQ